MELANEYNGQVGSHEMTHDQANHGTRALPSTLGAPAIVSAWQTRMLLIAAVATIVSLIFLFFPAGRGHIFRAYLLGYVMTFSFAGGSLALLMLQYVSGGKWGLLLRRPLEAMARTLPVIAVLFLPIAIFQKKLYLWSNYPTNAAARYGVQHFQISEEQALATNAKRAMLNHFAFYWHTYVVFAILGTILYFLQKWSVERDADPTAGSQRSYDKWQKRFENLSGPGILIYVSLMTVCVLEWVMSLDVTWYSSVWGLQFLVGQGFLVLAASILTVILLSKTEPMKTILRTTEQHDLGKFLFAFVMLNIYLNFAEYLIIWSGNVPDEIPWYLNRTRGGWWVICLLDFIFHWVIPFTLLLSRDLKRNKRKMIILTSFMIFARAFDLFWLIEPNFADAARNLRLVGNIGILAYITVPVAVVAAWAWFYLQNLKSRPLVNTNDPHLAEILEPEHAH